MDSVKYRRNWCYEQDATVQFVDGSEKQLFCRTDNIGRIDYIVYQGEAVSPNQFGELGIMSVHFMTPARLEVKSPINVLVKAYLKLGESIGEGDKYELQRKLTRRASIEKEIRKRGVNIHDAMSEFKE